MSGLDEVPDDATMFSKACSCSPDCKGFTIINKHGKSVGLLEWWEKRNKVDIYLYDYRITSKSIDKHTIKCHYCWQEIEDVNIVARVKKLVKEYLEALIRS